MDRSAAATVTTPLTNPALIWGRQSRNPGRIWRGDRFGVYEWQLEDRRISLPEHSLTMFYRKRDLSLRIRVALAALASVASTAAIIMALLAAHQADHQAAETETRLVEASLQRQVEAHEAEQLVISHWDEAVIHARRGDQRWLGQYFGAWMFESYGHDRSYALDPKDGIVFIMRGGEQAEPVLDPAEAPILDLAATLRARLAIEIGRAHV